MARFKIGVMTDSFRVPFEEGVVKAAEVGAQGIQLYVVGGETKYDTFDDARIERTKELLAKNGPAESSASIRERVIRARQIQHDRFEKTGITCNGRMEPAQLLKYCKLDRPTEVLIRHAITEFGLSARAYDRILRVSRTIADLAGSENIRREHIFEAIGYRSMDRRN